MFNRKFLHRLQQHLRQKRWLLMACIATPVIMLALAVLIVNAGNRLQRAYESLERVLYVLNEKPGTALTLDDFDALNEATEELITRLERAQLYSTPLRPFAGLNADLAMTLQSLDVAHDLGSAADLMLDGLRPALVYLVAGEEDAAPVSNLSGAVRLQQLLAFSVPGFEAGGEHLDSAGARLAELAPATASEGQVMLYVSMQDFYAQLSDLNTVLLASPELVGTLAGIDTEQHYLLLAQNNDEIRPAGGFIGTYGWFSVLNGHISDFDYSASTEDSPNPPDEAFLDAFTIPEWWLRYQNPVYAAWDGSHEADFATMAALAADYYTAGDNQPVPLAGVLAIDVTGFELLLGAMGDVPVPDYNVVLNAANFRETIYDIRAERQRPIDHKLFLADVYAAIQEAWVSLPEENIPAFAGALLSGLRQKHILLYTRNAEVQTALHNLNIAGTQRIPEQGDYLLVADANLSGNKSNNSIIRSSAYDVTLNADGSAEQRVSLLYEYLQSRTQDDPAVNPRYHGPLLYLNRFQVFAPDSAVLRGSQNLPQLQAIDADNYTQFVARVQLQHDRSARYELRYESENLVREMGEYRHYRLHVQKQPGRRTEALSVRIILPEGAELIASNPDEPALYEREDQIALDFLIEQDSDVWIDVIYRLP